MNRAVKLKEPSVVRTYDQDGFRKRAACICVNDDESKVLLVSSRKDANQWIVPGGGVEPEEAVDSAAIREVQEEAGVSGNLGRCLGVFENAERGHRTSVYVLVVTEELDDWDESRTFGRQRQWFTVEAAVGALHKPLQSSYVKLLLPPDHLYHTQPPPPSSRHSADSNTRQDPPTKGLRNSMTGDADVVPVGNGATVTADTIAGNGVAAVIDGTTNNGDNCVAVDGDNTNICCNNVEGVAITDGASQRVDEEAAADAVDGPSVRQVKTTSPSVHESLCSSLSSPAPSATVGGGGGVPPQDYNDQQCKVVSGGGSTSSTNIAASTVASASISTG